MASAIPNSLKLALMNNTIDLATDDLRARLVMTNTTCDTEVDAINTLANYTTIDPADATGYADVALTESTAVDDTNNRAEMDVTDFSFTGLGGDATRAYQGVLIYKYVDGTNANDVPCFYSEFDTTKASTSTAVNVTVDAQGILQLA